MLTVTKALNGNRIADTDQFTVQILQNGTTVVNATTNSTTTGTGSTVSGGTTGATTLSSTNQYMIKEVAAGTTKLGQYGSTLTCLNADNTNRTLPLNTLFSLVDNDTITCTLTNTKAPAKLTLQKTTTVGTGTFSFNGGAPNANGFPSNGSYSITTLAAGTAVTGTAATLTATNVQTDVTETVPSSWALSTASCTDLNAAASGNPTTSFGTLNGNKLTIPALNVLPGANLLCSFTNAPALATLTIVKNTTGGTGTFTFNGKAPNANGFSSDGSYSITTLAANTDTPGSTVALAATNAQTEVTETLPATWALSSASCTDANGTVSGNGTASFGSLSGSTLTILPGNVLSGSDIRCKFTNAPVLPTLTVTQRLVVAAPYVFKPPVTFYYSGDNGWTTLPITSNKENLSYSAGPQTLTAINTDTTVQIVQTSPNWSVASFRCTDSNYKVSGNQQGSLASNTASSITIPAAAVRASAVITCAILMSYKN